MSIIKRVATGQLADKSAENEFNNIIRQVPHKDDVLSKTGGFSGTILFYASSSSGGPVTQKNTVIILNGQITSWIQQ